MSVAADRLTNLARAVHELLCKWQALEIAVGNSFGGVNSQQKGEWLKSETVKYLMDQQTPSEIDVEYFLSTIMDREFDTIIEDGSLADISKQLCDLWKTHKARNKGDDSLRVQSKSKVCHDNKECDEQLASGHVTKSDCVANHVTTNHDGWIEVKRNGK